MPTKTCRVCGDVYWARWRNTPAVCESCALVVVICPECWHVRVERDPAQLDLFASSPAAASDMKPWSIAGVVGHHFANHVPRSFDWESYTEQLLSEHRAQNWELADHPLWPRRASRAERQRYPFH